MTATILKFPPVLRVAPDPEHKRREADMATARLLGWTRARPCEPGYVPLLGRINDHTQPGDCPQLED